MEMFYLLNIVNSGGSRSRFVILCRYLIARSSKLYLPKELQVLVHLENGCEIVLHTIASYSTDRSFKYHRQFSKYDENNSASTSIPLQYCGDDLSSTEGFK